MPIQGILQVACTTHAGPTITATFNYNPSDGTLTSGQVVNNSNQPVNVRVTDQATGQTALIPVSAGTTNLTQAQINAAGFMNVSQIRLFTVDCP